MKKLLSFFAIYCLFCFSGYSQIQSTETIPLPEHPRPDFMRSEWVNLNGYWDFNFDKENIGESQKWFLDPSSFNKKILVPFPWGSKLSEVAKEADIAWYARKVKIPEAWKNKRIFVVVGASDYATTGWVNGKQVGSNRGGYTPFEFELTSNINWSSEQNLVFKVDDSKLPYKLEGKQGYGDVKGFWQTVYLEARGSNYTDMVHFTPDIDNNKANLEISFNQPVVKNSLVTVKFNTGKVQTFTAKVKKGMQTAHLEIPIPDAHLWNLDDPFLYETEVSLVEDGKNLDNVSSYFGMRKISVTKLPGSDYPYVALNNKPIYLQLTLDQSYHPDGFYTFPSDEFMKNEILMSKRIGLNGNRIHIKVEVPRKLYWADRLGLLIMADVPNSWGDPDDAMFRESEFTMRGMIKRDYNHPSIFSWVLFNETWSLASRKNGKRGYQTETQARVAELYKKAKSLDQSRLVEDNSPCNNDHVVTDLNSWHSYLPGYDWKSVLDTINAKTYEGSKWNYIGGNVQGNQPMLNSECGNVWGYEGSTGDIDWSWDYHIMMNEFRMHPKMCGWLYTEHHDVINEWNGYYRFDRSHKFTGIENLMPGMTLNDLHNPYYISTGSEICRNVETSAKIDVPLYLSVLNDKLAATNLNIKAELCGWDAFGRFEIYSNYSLTAPYSPWMTKDIGKLAIQMPAKRSVAVLRMTLETSSGQVLARNFTMFNVSNGQSPRNETITQDGKQITLLRFAPNTFTTAKWTQKQWSVLDGLKVNGAGSGFFEYQVALPSGIKAEAISSVRIIAELSAKQLFGKDKEGANIIAGDYMLGQGTNDPSRNKNSYPMTDEKRFPSMVRIIVNNSCVGTFNLEDDPADHRGILSWNSQKKDKTLKEAGSYGYLVEANIPTEMIKESEGKNLLIRFEVDSALPHGLAIYGENFGRYPIDPTICFEMK
ncbi:MAG: sugar-binding domain-containing protein [Mariniphaga sp.]